MDKQNLVIKSSKVCLINHFIRMLFVMAIFFTFLVFVSGFYKNVQLCYLFATLALVVNFIWVFCFNNICVEADDEKVSFYRLGKLIRVILRKDSTFSSYVELHSINHIPTHSLRYLKVLSADGTIQYKCSNVSAKDFSDLISLLNVKTEKSASAENKSVGIKVYGVFYPPKEQFVGNFRRMALLISSLLMLIGVGFCWWYRGVMLNNPHIRGDGYQLFLYGSIGFVSTIIIPVIMIVYFYFLKIKRTTVAVVQITGGGVSFDQKFYSFADVDNFKVTPFSYSDDGFHNKRYVIVSTKGKKHTYFFGVMHDTLAFGKAYADYENFCKTLKMACDEEGARFIYNLG